MALLTRFALLALVVLPSCDGDKPETNKPPGGRPTKTHEHKSTASTKANRNYPGDGNPKPADENILDELLNNHGNLSSDQKQSAIALMRSGDIETCKKALELMPVGPFYETLLGEFAERFAKEDLVASIDWLKQLPQEGHLQKAYSSIGRNAALDPSLAEGFIRSVGDQGLKAEFSAGYLLGLSQQKNTQALKALISDPQRLASLGLNHDIIFDSIVRGGVAQASVDQSLETVGILFRAGIVPSGSLGDMAIRRVTSKDPAIVATYLAANKDLPHINRIAEPALEAWGTTDPIMASQWLRSQEGTIRDSGAAGLAKSIARSEPQSAVVWAISINDPALRIATLNHVASRSKFEREQIHSIIQNSDFDQQTKDSYLGIFK